MAEDQKISAQSDSDSSAAARPSDDTAETGRTNGTKATETNGATTADHVTETTAVKRSAPGVAAASRARRIGGRVTPPATASRSASGSTSRANVDGRETGIGAPSGTATGVRRESTTDGARADIANADTDSSAAKRRRGTWPSLTKTRGSAGAAGIGAVDTTAADTGLSDPALSGAGFSDTEFSGTGTASAKKSKVKPAAPRVRTPAPAWLSWVPATVLSVGVIVVLVFIAVFSHGVWWAKTSAASQREQVLAAAKQCLAATNTYNYKTFAADEKKGLACTTGKYTSDYRKAMETIVKPTATNIQASQTTQINEAGIESITANGKQWTILIYGQFKVTSTNTGATGRVDPFGAVVRMQNVDGAWRIVKLDSAAS